MPYFRVNPVAASEGAGSLAFEISLDEASGNEVRVSVQLLNGSAIANNSADFHARSETLVFAPGQTTKSLTAVITDNTTAEGTESFWIDLHSPVNGVVPQRYTLAALFDNDGTTGTPGVSVGDAVVDEGAGTATFLVWLNRPSASPLSVAYTTANDTAAAGSDFRAASGVLFFAPGEMVKTVQIDIVDDSLTEITEAFKLVLGNPGGATIVDGQGAGIIGHSDQPAVGQPQLSVQPIVVAESDALTAFLLQLSAPSSSSVSVSYQLINGTAIANNGADFLAKSETLVFAPGETTRLIPLLLTDNTIAENDESFSIDLISAVNATVSQRFSTATIIDNDGSGGVFSRGASHDLYKISNALDRIAESANGGIDTVLSSVSFTLPDQVENLVLTGTALNGIGNAGQNILRGTAGNNTLDGREGVDSAIFSGPWASYALAGNAVSRTVSGGPDGNDSLLSVERLQFSDTILADDTTSGGNTYRAYAMVNAVFDRAPTPAELSQWTSTLDRLGGNLRDLAQTMINHYAPGVPDDALVAYLWSTIIETPIPPDMLSTLAGLVADGTITQSSLLEFVTTFGENTAEIVGIVGQTLALDPAWFVVPGT